MNESITGPQTAPVAFSSIPLLDKVLSTFAPNTMDFDTFLTLLVLLPLPGMPICPFSAPLTAPYQLRHIHVIPSVMNVLCSPLLLYYSCGRASLPVNRDPFELWNHILLIFLSPEPGLVTGTPEVLSKRLLD